MPTGAITGYIDVAQLVLYAFWIFFAGLVFYLRREDKREGYPLESDRSERSGGRVTVQGFPAMPAPKTMKLAHGGSVTKPDLKADRREIRAAPAAAFLGAALEPTGNPMLDGVGPAAYALREDVPDVTLDGRPLIVPMRLEPGYSVAGDDPDPRGMLVVGADGEVGGKIVDLWVDRSEPQLRYLEVLVAGTEDRKILVPGTMIRIDPRRGQVRVQSVHGRHFADAPTLRNPEQVTRLEEDRICGYFAAGWLYADPMRKEPLI
jgi:photosynthetic reaction center H subunit